MAKKINENVVVLEEYATEVAVPVTGTAEHRSAAIERNMYRKYVYRRTNTYIYVGYTINEWCQKPEWLKGYLSVHNNGAVEVEVIEYPF